MLPLYQPSLFDAKPAFYNIPFPSTRYQGSKRKLTDWIIECLHPLDYDTVLDVFGGTGSVSHRFKTLGKQVTYNDKLKFNWLIGKALIENVGITLENAEVERILQRQPGVIYPNFIQATFDGIYYPVDENAWLDYVIWNIEHLLTDSYQQAIAYFALFQACIIKRPYNLFHRANLYMRDADVNRSFGNKVTWDTPFETHFRHFVSEANAAAFDNGRTNCAQNCDALKLDGVYDLVYIDPPYVNAKGVGVDYQAFYHFLEGIAHYEVWETKIDYTSKHRKWVNEKSAWINPREIESAFRRLFEHYHQSALVVSYRDDGIPSVDQLRELLLHYKPHVDVYLQRQKYVLSKQNSHEVLIVAH